jgi:hypothetical protein
MAATGHSFFNWLISKKAGLREEDTLEINQSERRMACAGHVC